MNRKKKGLKAILALLLTLALVIGMVPSGVLAAGQTKVADTDTRYDYESFLGDNNSTRYAGRVWTDKSVSAAETVEFKNPDSTASTAPVTVTNDSNFLVTYSALATSQSIYGQQPVDVVFVLDFSMSMTWAVGQNHVVDQASSRIQALVDSMNNAIHTLVQANENNRIGIVTFHGQSHVVQGLMTVVPRSDQQYLEINSFTRIEDDEANVVVMNNMTGDQIIGANNGTSTGGGTNIQSGIYYGANMLATETDTTYTSSDGTTVTRIPNIILMSDGAPTTFSSAYNATWYDNDGNLDTGTIDRSTELDSDSRVQSGSWWNGVSNVEIGSGNNNDPDSADGFMTLLTAAYMKNAVTAHYYGNLTGEQANFYSIGFNTGENTQTPQMVAMANVVLDPATYLGQQTNYDEVNAVAVAWNTYSATNNGVIVQAPIGQGNIDTKVDYQVERADDGNNPTSLNYPTEAFSADDADALNQIFSQITNMITESAKAPTETNPNNPAGSGYITYTDTIGDYMQVDAVKALIWAGEEFVVDGEPTTVDTVTTYKFIAKDGTGTDIDSPVYGQHDVNHIIVTVTRNPGKKEVLKVEIPANSIPLRVNYVEVNADGTVARNTNNGALPLRLCYTVGLKQEIRAAIDSATGILDLEKITDETLKSQLVSLKDANGNLTFYSNAYNGNTISETDQRTVGDATVEFTPADDNPFYFIQEDTPLYINGTEGVINEGGELETAATGTFDSSAIYYFKIQYYEGTKLVERVIKRSGSLLADYVEGGDGEQLYIQAGAPRLGNLQDFTKNKEIINDDGTTTINNITGTAQTYFYPEYIADDPDNPSPYHGHFLVHLGNNGKLTVPTQQQTGSITITKTDGAGEPLEGAGFTLFEVTTDPTTGEITNRTPVDLDSTDQIDPDAGLDGKYPYEKTTSYYQAIAIENPDTDQNYDSSTNRYTVANSDGTTSEYIVHRDDNNTLYYYVPIEESKIEDSMTIVAMVEFSNLDISKTYQFVETTRPAGYIQNTDGTSGAITLPVNGVYDIQYEVVNHRNISLPSSGLGGVTTLLMIGAVLVVAGAGYLILRKRKIN